MSERLGRKVVRAARRRARGQEAPGFPVVRGAASSGRGPFDGLPDALRKVEVIERGGFTVTTYLDTPADAWRARQGLIIAEPEAPADTLPPENDGPPPSPPTGGIWSRLEEADRDGLSASAD